MIEKKSDNKICHIIALYCRLVYVCTTGTYSSILLLLLKVRKEDVAHVDQGHRSDGLCHRTVLEGSTVMK